MTLAADPAMSSASTSGVKEGDVIEGKYVVRARLGEGGMGSVFLADQPALERQVAIKMLRPELVLPMHIHRMREEAVAAGHVVHPHCVGVIDHGLLRDGTPYLVMQYVPGQSLGRLIATEQIAPARALDLMRQILAALGAVHDANIVHGDVKSDNFLVGELDGREHVTMIDFGLARLSGTRPHLVTETGELLVSGTPEYMAPEVIDGQLPTSLSDLYGAGVVLYEMLTGSTPFPGDSLMDLLVAQRPDGELQPPSRRAPERNIPAALDAVVLRALAIDPAARFQDVAAFARALCVVPQTDARELRARIGAALVCGDVAMIAHGYLALAHALVDRGERAVAMRELEEGIDVLSLGNDRLGDAARPLVDRLVVALAALHEEAGAHQIARRVAAASDFSPTLVCTHARTALEPSSP